MRRTPGLKRALTDETRSDLLKPIKGFDVLSEQATHGACADDLRGLHSNCTSVPMPVLLGLEKRTSNDTTAHSEKSGVNRSQMGNERVIRISGHDGLCAQHTAVGFDRHLGERRGECAHLKCSDPISALIPARTIGTVAMTFSSGQTKLGRKH